MLWRDLRLDMSYRLPWAMDALALVSIIAIYYYIVRFTHARVVGAPDFFTYIVPGLALLRFQLGLLRTIIALDRDQTSGTLELIFGAPARSWVVAGAASLYELLRGAALAIVTLAVGRWIFGAGLTLGPRSWAALALGLIGAMAFFMALTSVNIAVLIAFKQGQALAGFLTAVIPVVSGIYFAPHVLPPVLQSITRIIPLTLAVDVLRAGVVSATFSWGKSLVMLAATFACLPLGALAVQIAVRRAERLGTLGQY
jgi:ABC-type multidrug transport system permease subunit